MRFVESIPMTGSDTIILTEGLEILTTESADAKVFKYANFYFEADAPRYVFFVPAFLSDWDKRPIHVARDWR